jgi:hypothetical protein
MSARSHYAGGWTELFDELTRTADDTTKRRDSWPKNSQSLSNKLRECAPNLRAVGVEVEIQDSARPKRVVLKSKYAAQPVEHPACSSGGAGGAAADVLPYVSVAQVACYGNDWTDLDTAEATLKTLVRIWTAPPLAASVAPAAAPSLVLPNCDGAQVMVS